MGEEQLKEETTENFIKYLEDRGMLDQYLDDHKHLGEFLAEKTPEIFKNVGEAITAKIIEKSGSGMKNLGDKISDKRFLQDLGQSLLKSGKGIQFVGKALGPAFTAGEGIYGTYDDMANNDKTFGEAITHNATTTAVGVGVAAGILTVASGGIAVVGAAAAGAVLAKTTDFAYQKDFLGIKTNLDKAGHWIDDTADRAKESFSFVKDHPGEAFKAGLKSINPVAGLF